MVKQESIVAVVSESETQRLVVVLRETLERPIAIRTQTFSENVGWFTQQEIELTRSEFSGLKNVLGLKVPAACLQAVDAASRTVEAADKLAERDFVIPFSARRVRA